MSREHNESLWQQLPAEQKKAITQHLTGLRNGPPAMVQPKAKAGFALKGYIRCELAKTDKEAFAEWEKSAQASECMMALLALVDSGYILKVAENSEGYQASLSAASVTGDWNGYVLTAFASSPIRATMLLLYKHQIMMAGSWELFTAPSGEDVLR